MFNFSHNAIFAKQEEKDRSVNRDKKHGKHPGYFILREQIFIDDKNRSNNAQYIMDSENPNKLFVKIIDNGDKADDFSNKPQKNKEGSAEDKSYQFFEKIHSSPFSMLFFMI